MFRKCGRCNDIKFGMEFSLYACLHYQALQLQDHEKIESFRHALHFSADYNILVNWICLLAQGLEHWLRRIDVWSSNLRRGRAPL